MALLDAKPDVMPVLSARHDELAEAFEELAPRISYFFSRRGFSPEDCRDLTQDTFLRAYRGLSRFRDEAGLKTWLLRIAANVWKNALRERQAVKRSAMETVSLEEIRAVARPLSRVAVGGGGSDREDPLDQTIQAEKRRVLREAVGELPPRMRRCVLLRIDRGLKYREIATIMGVSEDTVKTQLHQARQRLKDGLGEYFSVDDGGE